MTQNIPRLKIIAETTDTDYWNDSCSTQELEYAVSNGAVGAATNPVIVYNVLSKELDLWHDRIIELAKQSIDSNEDEIAWMLIEEMAVKAAKILKPVFDRKRGLKGRISIQTNTKFHRDSRAMLEQAVRFDKLAPNMQVKLPVTAAGVEAIEEATYRGVNINATVCFSVSQAIAVAEAVKRAIARREKEGKDHENMNPVCTIMIGRIDDWLKIVAAKKSILIDPSYLELAGVAVIKNALRIYKKRGYRTRLLAAAYRNYYHISKLIGGGIIHTIPYAWQKKFNSTSLPISNTIKEEPDEKMIKALKSNFEDFVKAYEPDGMSVADFEHYGPTLRTLRAFINGYQSLLGIVRNIILPNPDIQY